MNGSPIQPGRRVENNTALRVQADQAAKELSTRARLQTSANRFSFVTLKAGMAAFEAKLDRINAILR